ncbi:MAG: fluoride efflux transporter CrcB [Candidatus Zixiibacteriota bacterium]
MKEIAIVFAGGGLGAAARFWMSSAVHRFAASSFPFGTLSVNALGCLLAGFLMSIFAERFLVSPNLGLFLMLGFLGGFTTYSTFSYETIELIRTGQSFHAFSNVAYTTLLCLAATWLGSVIGKMF